MDTVDRTVRVASNRIAFQYGDRLVCVWYRSDKRRKKRFKTVELTVEERTWEPAGGADWTTSYFYNALNQLTRVEMPRPYQGGTYTQVRTFTCECGDETWEADIDAMIGAAAAGPVIAAGHGSS